MYEKVSVRKLSESLKSKLCNGHPVRVKKGAGNTSCLNHDHIKRLEAAARKGKAITITLHGEQIEKHGSGIFGDIYTIAENFATERTDILTLLREQ